MLAHLEGDHKVEATLQIDGLLQITLDEASRRNLERRTLDPGTVDADDVLHAVLAEDRKSVSRPAADVQYARGMERVQQPRDDLPGGSPRQGLLSSRYSGR